MIRLAQKSDASEIALLHQRTLTSSFLAKLGLGFLKSLYIFLIKKELVIVHTEKNIVTGFVSFSANSSGMMKRFLYKCPICIFKLMGILIFSPGLLKRFMETFAAPFKSKTAQSSESKIVLPKAELLSISVDPDYQKSGIGNLLLNALEKQLLQNGVCKYKVIAGISLESGNKFYLRNGFVLVSQVMIHGKELSNIFVKTL